MSLNDLVHVLKGGAGSGFHGHSGRPGKRGGSSGGGGSSATSNRIAGLGKSGFSAYMTESEIAAKPLEWLKLAAQDAANHMVNTVTEEGIDAYSDDVRAKDVKSTAAKILRNASTNATAAGRPELGKVYSTASNYIDDPDTFKKLR